VSPGCFARAASWQIAAIAWVVLWLAGTATQGTTPDVARTFAAPLGS